MINVSPLPCHSRSWTRWELELVVDMHRKDGLGDIEFGVSNEGTPWMTFYKPGTHRILAAIARDGRVYQLYCRDKTIEQSPSLVGMLASLRRKLQRMALGSLAG